MPSHVIIGASKGIGYSFLQTLSQDPSNTVIGLVRTVEPTQKKVEADGLKNVTIVHADMEDWKSFKAAAEKVATITGGAVDHLWINAAYQGHAFTTNFFHDWEGKEPEMEKEVQMFWETNVNGAYRAINAFLPLVKKSSIKKVVAISSGHADTDLVARFGVWEDAPYAISKAALNMLIAKYAARFGPTDGILFLALSPGIVDVGKEAVIPPELGAKFFNYTPNMVGPIKPEQSVKYMLNMVNACDAQHDNGQFYSHMGKHRGWINPW